MCPKKCPDNWLENYELKIYLEAPFVYYKNKTKKQEILWVFFFNIFYLFI